MLAGPGTPPSDSHRSLALARHIAAHDEAIAEAFAAHPKAQIFASLPGAGPVFAPRLLTLFGERVDRLKAYKGANANDVEYYGRVVNEAPDRARDMLLYKDMQKHESEMRLAERQLPQAKEFYDAQSPEVQARIDQRLDNVRPYFRDKAFVGEVLREMNRKNWQILTKPANGVAVSIG